MYAGPDSNYALESRYVEINGAETKIYDTVISSSVIPTADQKFVASVGLGTPTIVKVYPKFVENPDEWYTLHFTHSAHSTLSGNTTVKVGKSTKDASNNWSPTTWMDVPKPTATPTTNYVAGP